MNAETIKDFLVSLGFQVDEAGSRKFEATIAGATVQAMKLGTAVEAAALSVVAFTAKVASGLDNLYWMSQRTGATVDGIRQISYAVSQMGGSVDAARGSLENLARFVRNNPGAEGFLNRLGVQTRDASGNMRDMATIFTGVGQRLSSMPYYRANQYAQMLGIDENTLMAMRRGVGEFSAQYSQMAKAIGYNSDAAAVSANRFMTSLNAFGQMAGMARDKIGSNLADGLAGSLDNLRKLILDNFPKIEQSITTVVKGILWLGDALGRVIYRLIQAAGDIRDWWGQLDKGTRDLIELIGGLVVAWRLLNAAMMASPVTWVLGLAGALVLLYDDFRTWKEGGKSLIDWGKWEPGIQYAMRAFKGLGGEFRGLYDKVAGLGSALGDAINRFLEFINIDTSGFSGKWLFDQIIESVRSTIKYVGALVDALKKLVNGDFSGAWDSLKEAATSLSGSPMMQGATSVVTGVFEKAGETFRGYLPEWMGGTPEQHGQAAKRGERNNNPGNLNFVGQAGATLENPGGRFARFETAYEGLRALSRQLMLYAGRGINSVEKIISTWAPALDNNDTAGYIKAVSQQLGVNPKVALNMSDPQTMSALMNSIIHHENGRNIYSSDLINRAAVEGIGGPQVHQQNTYNIYGGNAHDVGQEVGRRQIDANARVLRANQNGVG